MYNNLYSLSYFVISQYFQQIDKALQSLRHVLGDIFWDVASKIDNTSDVTGCNEMLYESCATQITMIHLHSYNTAKK